MNHLPTILFRGYIYVSFRGRVFFGGISSPEFADSKSTSDLRRTIPASHRNLEKMWLLHPPKRYSKQTHLKRYIPSLKLMIGFWGRCHLKQGQSPFPWVCSGPTSYLLWKILWNFNESSSVTRIRGRYHSTEASKFQPETPSNYTPYVDI